MDAKVSPTHLVTCGFSHATAPIELRERYQLSKPAISETLRALMRNDGVGGVVVISTCNRLELYVETEAPGAVVDNVLDVLGGTDDAQLRRALYTRVDTMSARHLFRVCAGLDSLVLGENQIQRQVKEAYSLACRERAASTIIHRVFHEGFRVGKAVRANTEIGKGPKSVSGVAMELLSERFESLRGRPTLLIGVSPMNEIAAEKLNRLGASLSITNRTMERAEHFAKQHHARAIPFERLDEALLEADIVVSCTGSSEPIVTAKRLRDHLDVRQRELCLVDLAVPRDFEPLSSRHSKLFKLDVDDLNIHHRRNQQQREQASMASESIVEQSVTKFGQWLRLQKLAPRVKAASKEAQRLFERDLALASKHHTPEQMDAIEQFGRIVLKHTLDATLRILRETPSDMGGPDVLETSEQLNRQRPAVCRILRKPHKG